MLFIIESFRTTGPRSVRYYSPARRSIKRSPLREASHSLISLFFPSTTFLYVRLFRGFAVSLQHCRYDGSLKWIDQHFPSPFQSRSRRRSRDGVAALPVRTGPAISHGNSLAYCLNYKLKQHKEIKKNSVNDYSSAYIHTLTHKRTISYVVTMGEREGGVNGYKKSRQQNRNVRFRKKKKGAWVHVCNAIEVTRKIRTREREKLRSRRNKWGGGRK